MKIIILKLCYGLVMIVHGILYLISIGHIHTNWPLKVAAKLAKLRYYKKYTV